MSATTITATIESKTKATLACGDPLLEQQLMVNYSNSGPNATQITQGSMATLTIDGFPKGEIRSVTLWMKSNSNSGSASISVNIADYRWYVEPCSYKDWPGVSSYSVTPQAIRCVQECISVDGQTKLQVQIEGTANSVYLSRIEVEYVQYPCVVTAYWMDSASSWHSCQLVEDSAGSGIMLPLLDLSPIWYGDTTWYGVGWCEQSISVSNEEPLYWTGGDRYFPSSDCSLFALYSNNASHTLLQDTSFVSGEYLLVRRLFSDAWVLKGAWNNKKINMQPINIQRDGTGLAVTIFDKVNDTCRYMLDFTADSVHIQNMSLLSQIGYGWNAGGRSTSTWAWRKANDGTIFIHNEWEETVYSPLLSYSKGKSLCLDRDMETWDTYVSYGIEAFFPDSSFWYLFPSIEIPLQKEILYTTFVPPTAINDCEYTSGTSQSARLIRTKEGLWIISNDKNKYDLLGRRIL